MIQIAFACPSFLFFFFFYGRNLFAVFVCVRGFKIEAFQPPHPGLDISLHTNDFWSFSRSAIWATAYNVGESRRLGIA